MALQVAHIGECFIAVNTDKWFLFVMQPQVFFIFCFGDENGLAEFANRITLKDKVQR